MSRSAEQLSFLEAIQAPPAGRPASFEGEIRSFCDFGKATVASHATVSTVSGAELTVPVFVNEFWTARQRQAHSLHEISYRACFKPQLPRFFIERLTKPGDVVYDPFLGRGTTALEAALLGRIPFGCDINPLSKMLLEPRLRPPAIENVQARLAHIDLRAPKPYPEDLLVFFHPETLAALTSLREWLLQRQAEGPLTPEDAWIRLVSLNRLTGHSSGFFSVYTLPPNQAVSVVSQRKINAKRGQEPPPRDLSKIIFKKSRILLSDCDSATRQNLSRTAASALFVTADARSTAAIKDESVDLVVTSPPFLNVVDYATDNWLRCWFAGIDPSSVQLTVPRKIAAWEEAMTDVLKELKRVLRAGGHIAFEVGEVHKGTTRLEEHVVKAAVKAGLHVEMIIVNSQKFTKTAQCWGIENMTDGTNSNRIVLMSKA